MNEEEIKILNDIFNNYEYDLETNPIIDTSIMTNIFEISYAFDGTIMGIEVSLIGEIDELLEQGFNKRKIFNLLIDSYPLSDKLSNEENFYLMKSATKLIEIRFKLYLKELIKKDIEHGQRIEKLKKLNFYSLNGKYRKK